MVAATIRTIFAQPGPAQVASSSASSLACPAASFQLTGAMAGPHVETESAI
jgi:hypothetical protein